MTRFTVSHPMGIAVLAAPSTKETLKFLEPVNVQGKQLTAGQYTVEASGEAPNVELNIVGSGK